MCPPDCTVNCCFSFFNCFVAAVLWTVNKVVYTNWEAYIQRCPNPLAAGGWGSLPLKNPNPRWRCRPFRPVPSAPKMVRRCIRNSDMDNWTLRRKEVRAHKHKIQMDMLYDESWSKTVSWMRTLAMWSAYSHKTFGLRKKNMESQTSVVWY